jgi:sulfur carrier protein
LSQPGGFDVQVNGDGVSVPAGSTIADLLSRLSLDSRRVAVELNLEIVPRAEHGTRRLSSGDRLEIVTFVGGGAC